MAHEKNHDYHILNPSLWPLLGAIAGFVMLFGAVLFSTTVDLGYCWRACRRTLRHVWMVVGYGHRKSDWGSHARGSYRVKIRLHPVYHVRSHVLFRCGSGVFSNMPCTRWAK